ncbi:hypothetical protein ALC53_02068, partial [Atta colombica]
VGKIDTLHDSGYNRYQFSIICSFAHKLPLSRKKKNDVRND